MIRWRKERWKRGEIRDHFVEREEINIPNA